MQHILYRLKNIMQAKRQEKRTRSRPVYVAPLQEPIIALEQEQEQEQIIPSLPTRQNPQPEPPKSHRETIRQTIEQFEAEGRVYTYQEIANTVPCSLTTVKKYAPQIKAQMIHDDTP